MRTTKQMSVTLPLEMAAMVRARVASGEYASESEVIREGIRTLAARDRALEERELTRNPLSFFRQPSGSRPPTLPLTPYRVLCTASTRSLGSTTCNAG